MSGQQEISWITDEDCKLMDNAKLCIGSGASTDDPSSYDICIRWDGTDLDVLQGTANSAINFGVDGAGIDLKLFGDTASAYLLWDQSADDLILSGAAGLVMNGTAGIKLGDDVALAFGASDDVTIDWNAGGGLDVLVAADNSLITLGNGTLSADLKIFAGEAATYIYYDCDADTNRGSWSFGLDDHGMDVYFYGATASSLAVWDQSADEMYFDGADLWLKDDDRLEFGDSSDVVATWAAGGGLNVTVAADNTVVTVGTGTLSADLKWFGGDTSTWVYFDADGGSATTGEWAFGVDDHGVDVKFYGATASQYLLWDESANQLLTSGTAVTVKVGAQANTAGSGTRVTSGNGGTVRVFSDDGGASIGDSVRGVQSRFLISATQAGGTIRALQGQLKVADTFGAGTGIYTAVQGYVELAGTHAIGTGATASAFDSSTEIGTALTVDSGAEYYGVHVETTGAGTITNNGTCAGIGVTAASGAAAWPVGIQINCDSVLRGIQVGTLGSNITSGVPLLNATSINGFYSDDNGADQTTSTVYRNVTARTYFSVNQTAASADYHVLRGHLKAASGVNLGGDASVKSAVNAYVELAGATTVGAGSFLAGVFGEIWTDGNLVGTGKAAGVMSRFYSSAGTVSGTTAAFMATKQWASTQNWPYGLYIDAATIDIRLTGGPCILSGTGSPNGAVTAPKGSIYLRFDNSSHDDTVYCNTDGSTTWAAIVSA